MKEAFIIQILEDIDIDEIHQRNKQSVRMGIFQSVSSIQQTVDMFEDRNANLLESCKTYTANVSEGGGQNCTGTLLHGETL